MKKNRIYVNDQTIREGMQYRGLMFSYAERMKILEFQESLCVDISQVGYPPAHKSETTMINKISSELASRSYNIRIFGLCRAIVDDICRMIEAGLTEFHLHTTMTKEMLKTYDINFIFDSLKESVRYIRSRVKNSVIAVSILDIGKTDLTILKKCTDFLINKLEIDILSLPDTSGIIAPNIFFDRVKSIVQLAQGKSAMISIHCHNDMGMSSANTIMGAVAGASIIEVTALGIGERNGIGDIFLTGKLLKDQGYQLNLRTEEIEIFKAYYEYINDICIKKTGMNLINYNTPFFGDSMKIHVAGTHGIASYGLYPEKNYYLNVLCGKHLVTEYLKNNDINFRKEDVKKIVEKIKAKSVESNSYVTKQEVIDIVGRLKNKSCDPLVQAGLAKTTKSPDV